MKGKGKGRAFDNLDKVQITNATKLNYARLKMKGNTEMLLCDIILVITERRIVVSIIKNKQSASRESATTECTQEARRSSLKSVTFLKLDD